MRRALVPLVALLVACQDRAPESPTAEPPPFVAPPSTGAPGAPALPTATAVASAPAPFVPEKVWAEGKAMGTHLAFAAYTSPTVDAAKARAAWADAIAEIQRIEALMTTWREDSEISKINAAAGKEPVVVGAETLQVIQESIHTSEISEGTFDITFETLHGLWKFDQDLDPHPPKDADLKAKVKLLGYKHIKVDPAKSTVFLDKAGVKISLGGIAKGYGVDKAVAVLEKAGLTSFFVQAGGDLFARGKKPDGSEWSAGIRDPRGTSEKYFALIPLTDHSFSTAGDYERSYMVGTKRYHHIIDPRTGYPAAASRSVTVWAPTALLADAIDDAVFILGPEKGLKLVESLEGVGAVIVDAKNKVWVSKRLEGKVKITGVPTDAP
ncbi:MAG: FAD:protein FMN transferase [Polyangiaceae bacterium]|nr:FAD:protein FMN transferase [Polyangiaceae bacterium]